MVLEYLLSSFKTVHYRHVCVHEDELDLGHTVCEVVLLLHHLETFEAVLREQDCVHVQFAVLDEDLKSVPREVAIVDDEHLLALGSPLDC